MNLIEKEILTYIDSHCDKCYYYGSDELGEGIEYTIALDNINTLALTEDEYNSWSDFLNSIDIQKSNYQIYCSHDLSGYTYWKNIEEDTNYTHINVWIGKEFEEFDDNSFYSLVNDLDNILENLKMFCK